MANSNLTGVLKKFAQSLAGVAFFCCARAQNPLQPVFLNHVYFVLDSENYAHVFDSAIFRLIGNTSEVTTTTASSSWSGKYFNGLNSYLEIFPSNGFPGAAAGDAGLGFMTFKQGDIWQIKQYWIGHNEDSLASDTTTYISGGKKFSWFYSVSLYTPDTLLPVYAWIMENTPDDLKGIGFTDDEIRNPISWQQYYERRSGKKFIKPFSRITAIDLVADNKTFDYLTRSFRGFGLKRSRNNFHNDYILIHCTKAKGNHSRLKQITLALSKSFEERTIIINDHLSLHLKGDHAYLNFAD